MNQSNNMNIKRAKSQVVIKPSRYVLDTSGNLPLGTKIINTGFNFLRRGVRNFTGLLQKKAKKRQRYNMRRGYTSLGTRKGGMIMNACRMKRETKCIDFMDTLKYIDSSNEVKMKNADESELDFGLVVAADEFKNATKDWVYYKVLGAKLTFKPIAEPVKVTDPTGTIHITNALHLPEVMIQLGNNYRIAVFNDLSLNTPSFSFDPNSKETQVAYLRFNDNFLIPREEQDWKEITDSPWGEDFSPRIQFYPYMEDDIHQRLAQNIELGTLSIQIKVVGMTRDTSETTTKAQIKIFSKKKQLPAIEEDIKKEGEEETTKLNDDDTVENNEF